MWKIVIVGCGIRDGTNLIIFSTANNRHDWLKTNIKVVEEAEEKEVSKVLEGAKDQTTFLFTAVDRVAALMDGGKRLIRLLRGNLIL